MLNDDDVLSEGFRPLKSAAGKNHSSAGSFANRPVMSRGMSFNAETGAKESAQDLWEGSAWEKYGKSRGKAMDRGNSFVGTRSHSHSVAQEPVSQGAIVIVDPFSTGAHLAAEVCRLGHKCVRVFSIWDSPVAALVQKGLEIDYCATIQHNEKLEDQAQAVQDTVKALRDLPFPIRAVIPGAETGVELADQLSYHMGLRTNGITKSLARRNKYHMGETVRKTGIRTVKQATCKSLAEMHAFLDTLHREGDKLKCVVKPVQSAGTDDVFLCSHVSEAERAFKKIFGNMNGIGLLNESVLVQEYLLGTEYVVDKVSLDGVHKVVAIWQYDKRPVNGANFVYFGEKLMASDTPMAQVMSTYADTVLTALDIVNGPSHMEIMLHTRVDHVTGAPIYDPCLVEVGARCQGGEGTWLKIAKECIGFTSVEITLDVYLDAKLWNAIDRVQYPMMKAGREVDMVARHSGIVRSLPGDAAIRALPSFRGINWEVKPGDFVHKTIDCFTRPGCAELVADTEEEIEVDFERMHALEDCGLIDYSIICPQRPSIGSVVVVDPFSSGANLAALVLEWGYKLILVFSEQHTTAASLVSNSVQGHIQTTTMIQHNNSAADQEEALRQTLAHIQDNQSADSPIYAILAGGETGVELAERLAARFGVRSNGEAMIEMRRSKNRSQDVIRKAGARAIHEKLCLREAEVIEFFTRLATFKDFKSIVVKPNESVGLDQVFQCASVQEALEAFNVINNQINGLGQLNKGALCQELLSGTEFVVDGVSRDGVYKVVAIWKFDKRSVNGAAFVTYGMTLCDASTPELKAVVAYAQKVVKLLKINQGPSHMELICNTAVKHSHSGDEQLVHDVCLVEVNTRCHGGNGTWLPVAQECVGYTQLEATLNCYLRPDQFDALPAVPSLKQQGLEAFLVSSSEGVLQEITGLESIRELSSVRRLEMAVQPGGTLVRTVDSFTRPGSVVLVNSSIAELRSDYFAIHEMCKRGEMFRLK